MRFFKKRAPQPSSALPQPTAFSSGLPRAGDALPAPLRAHSRFIKRVNCIQCGAPKSLPSPTAYLYCDYCGALMDYDFRIANANTNAGLTNTVYHRIQAAVQEPLTQAKARGDQNRVRELYRQIYAQWIQECPMAASPRAKNDPAFREQFVAYSAECAVVKDFDPRQTGLNARMFSLEASLERIPAPNGAWQVAGPFWEYAALFKQVMEMTYTLLHARGVDAMDPDHAPAGVALRMEYSTFCQGWLPHLSPDGGQRLLELFGLDAEYDEVKPLPTDNHQCGACGGKINTLRGAKKVVCDFCGFRLDVGSEPVPCRKCGAHLSLPVSAQHVLCPYCGTDTRRV